MQIGRVIKGRRVEKILHEFTIVYAGWECDSTGWVVQFDDGGIEAVETSHNAFYISNENGLQDHITEAQESIDGLVKAIEILKTGKPIA